MESKILTPIEKVNLLFDKYKDNTNGFFHNVLWQLLVNNVRKDVESAFVYIYGSNGVNVGIADKNVSGYTPATFYIKPEVSEDERVKMIDDLNLTVFGITNKKAFEIEISSMKS